MFKFSSDVMVNIQPIICCCCYDQAVSCTLLMVISEAWRSVLVLLLYFKYKTHMHCFRKRPVMQAEVEL